MTTTLKPTIKKYVDYSYSNDAFSWDDPIHQEFYNYRLLDNTTETVCIYDNGKHFCINENPITNTIYVKASEEEIKDFYHKCGYIYKGDQVVIARGKKMVGEIKTVRYFTRFNVSGTYGKVYTDYVVFTDGTKVNIDHCDVVDVEYFELYKTLRTTKEKIYNA